MHKKLCYGFEKKKEILLDKCQIDKGLGLENVMNVKYIHDVHKIAIFQTSNWSQISSPHPSIPRVDCGSLYTLFALSTSGFVKLAPDYLG